MIQPNESKTKLYVHLISFFLFFASFHVEREQYQNVQLFVK